MRWLNLANLPDQNRTLSFATNRLVKRVCFFFAARACKFRGHIQEVTLTDCSTQDQGRWKQLLWSVKSWTNYAYCYFVAFWIKLGELSFDTCSVPKHERSLYVNVCRWQDLSLFCWLDGPRPWITKKGTQRNLAFFVEMNVKVWYFKWKLLISTFMSCCYLCIFFSKIEIVQDFQISSFI